MQRFRCTFPGCKYPPFVSAQSLKNHLNKCHNPNPPRKSIRQVGHLPTRQSGNIARLTTQPQCSSTSRTSQDSEDETFDVRAGPSRLRRIGQRPDDPEPLQLSQQIPYPDPGGSPQIKHRTPDHSSSYSKEVGITLAELDPDCLAPHLKKVSDDWFAVFNPRVPRVLDVDLLHTLPHDSIVTCVRFSPDGRYVAMGCNRSAHIFDVITGQTISVLPHDWVDFAGDMYIRSVCFSPDGKYLALATEDNLIRVWDVASNRIRNIFSGHESDVYSIDFTKDGRTIASGSGDRTVRLWDVETGANIQSWNIEDGVTSVAISPDTRYVAAGSLSKDVYIWEISTRCLVERMGGLDGHKDSVYSVAFAPNGKCLFSGSWDKTIKMWELLAPSSVHSITGPWGGRCLKTFQGHKDFVLSVAPTVDGAWVLSGSKDRNVQLWDPKTGSAQLMLRAHKDSVVSVATSPITTQNGCLFATSSGDRCRKDLAVYQHPTREE